MNKVSFDYCINLLKEGSVINFKEYVLDRHENKKLTISIEGGVVQAVIPADYCLSRMELEQYYGTELSDIDYLQLSRMNCPRIVVGLGINEEGQLDIKIIILNKDYYKTNLQELDIINESLIKEEPNYLLAQKGWF